MRADVCLHGPCGSLAPPVVCMGCNPVGRLVSTASCTAYVSARVPPPVLPRWRVYSLSEGDTLRTWRIEPFVMVEGGQRWIPPSMTAMAVSAGACTIMLQYSYLNTA